MLSLLYVSKVRKPFGQDQLKLLTEQSAAANVKRNVTGLLAFNGEYFMQLLEGEDEIVEGLINIIANDRRHSDMIVIRRVDDRVRECPDWSMQSLEVPLEYSGAASEIFNSLPKEFEADTRAIFTSFASLAKRNQ